MLEQQLQALNENLQTLNGLLAQMVVVRGPQPAVGLNTGSVEAVPSSLPAVDTASEKRPSGQRKRAKPEVADASTPPPAPEPAPEPVAGTHIPAGEITKEQLRTAAVTLSTTKGREAVVALFSEFGATGLPTLQPDQYAAVYARIQEMME